MALLADNPQRPSHPMVAPLWSNRQGGQFVNPAIMGFDRYTTDDCGLRLGDLKTPPVQPDWVDPSLADQGSNRREVGFQSWAELERVGLDHTYRGGLFIQAYARFRR